MKKLGAIPVLPVIEFNHALAFYQDRLGSRRRQCKAGLAILDVESNVITFFEPTTA